MILIASPYVNVIELVPAENVLAIPHLSWNALMALIHPEFVTQRIRDRVMDPCPLPLTDLVPIQLPRNWR